MIADSAAKINYAEVLLRLPITKGDVEPGDEIWLLPKGPAEQGVAPDCGGIT
jgi:hypothetical protein